jgi:hypothetical protein
MLSIALLVSNSYWLIHKTSKYCPVVLVCSITAQLLHITQPVHLAAAAAQA